jgi:hypothetical protein
MSEQQLTGAAVENDRVHSSVRLREVNCKWHATAVASLLQHIRVLMKNKLR